MLKETNNIWVRGEDWIEFWTGDVNSYNVFSIYILILLIYSKMPPRKTTTDRVMRNLKMILSVDSRHYCND